MLTHSCSRRWVYALGLSLYLLSQFLAWWVVKQITAALLCHAMAAATAFVCFNAYVLDHVAKPDFGRLESLRLLYGGAGFDSRPGDGCLADDCGAVCAFCHRGTWRHGHAGPDLEDALGNARVTCWPTTARYRTIPIVFLRRFFLGQSPTSYRLVFCRSVSVLPLVGVYRLCWHLYMQNGLGDQSVACATSLANAGLFVAPLMLRWIQRHCVREAVHYGFLLGGGCFILAALVSPWPWATVAMLVTGSLSWSY